MRVADSLDRSRSGVISDLSVVRKSGRVVLHLPHSRPLLNSASGLEVATRPDDLQRWDFPTVVELYRR